MTTLIAALATFILLDKETVIPYLVLENRGELITKLHDKRLQFLIVNFAYLRSNALRMVFLSQKICYARAYSNYGVFAVEDMF